MKTKTIQLSPKVINADKERETKLQEMLGAGAGRVLKHWQALFRSCHGALTGSEELPSALLNQYPVRLY